MVAFFPLTTSESHVNMSFSNCIGCLQVQLGMWRFQSKSQDCSHEGYMFAFEVKEELDVWPEKDVRKRLWVSSLPRILYNILSNISCFLYYIEMFIEY